MVEFTSRVDNFLKEYSDLLWDEHKGQILEVRRFAEEFKNAKLVNSIFGNHFTTCCWSHDNCIQVPDDCDCILMGAEMSKVNRILRWYKRLKHRMLYPSNKFITQVNMTEFVSQVDSFLKEYSDILWDDHKKTILVARQIAEKFINAKLVNSIFGTHYSTCCWSQDVCVEGPDFCECCLMEKKMEDVNKMLRWYKILKQQKFPISRPYDT